MSSTLPPTGDTAMHATTVRDMMQPGIVACDQSAGVAEVAGVMARCHVHCVAVISGAGAGEETPALLGLVSDIDLLRWATGPDTHLAVDRIGLKPAVTVAPSTTAQDAAEIMAEHATQHLVVLDPEEGAPVGMLSALDIAKVLATGTPLKREPSSFNP